MKKTYRFRSKDYLPFCETNVLQCVYLLTACKRTAADCRVPEAWGDRRTLLHFEAVDHETTVYVNGGLVGRHAGGYDRKGEGADVLIFFSSWALVFQYKKIKRFPF
jgi:hypothetical protein